MKKNEICKETPKCKGVSCKKLAPFSCPDFIPEDVDLRQWSVDAEEHQLPESFFCIICGSRRIGKSVFAKYLLFFLCDKFDMAVVLTETPQNGYWQPIVGNQYVHEGMNEFLVEHLFETQKSARALQEQSGGKKKAPRVLLILDDVIANRNKIHESPELNRLAVQGRHMNIAVILTTQYPRAINPTLRENCDLAVIFQQKTVRALQAVYEDFLSKLGPKEAALQILTKYTSEHDCIVVENWKLKQQGTDIIFWCPGSTTYDEKAEKSTVPDYQLGSEEQQKLARTKRGSVPIF